MLVINTRAPRSIYRRGRSAFVLTRRSLRISLQTEKTASRCQRRKMGGPGGAPEKPRGYATTGAIAVSRARRGGVWCRLGSRRETRRNKRRVAGYVPPVATRSRKVAAIWHCLETDILASCAVTLRLRTVPVHGNSRASLSALFVA